MIRTRIERGTNADAAVRMTSAGEVVVGTGETERKTVPASGLTGTGTTTESVTGREGATARDTEQTEKVRAAFVIGTGIVRITGSADASATTGWRTHRKIA